MVPVIQQLWVNEKRKTVVCVDSYEDGILRGRFYSAYQEAVTFDSLSQFLVRMESMLEENRAPQAYTTSRTFSTMLQPDDRAAESTEIHHGARATFELQILFRQHSSWQGLIVWQDKKIEQSFRSVLELVFLMDSALRSLEGCEAV